MVLPALGRFTHLTAAARLGWWLPPLPSDLPVFAAISTAEPRPRRRGLRVSRHAQLEPTSLVEGVRLDQSAEVLLSCARDLALIDLVVLLDSALRQGADRGAIDVASRRWRPGAPALRRGYTDIDVLHRSVSILRDADLSLGREHDPSRIRTWHRELAESLFAPSGHTRLRRRLGLPVPASAHAVGR